MTSQQRFDMRAAICVAMSAVPGSDVAILSLAMIDAAIAAVFDQLGTVDHAFLDKAREGLPIESGLAARFWLQAISNLKENR